MDTDNSGYLSEEEILVGIFKAHQNHGKTHDELAQIIHDYVQEHDEDGNGELDKDEFNKLVRKMQSYEPNFGQQFGKWWRGLGEAIFFEDSTAIGEASNSSFIIYNDTDHGVWLRIAPDEISLGVIGVATTLVGAVCSGGTSLVASAAAAGAFITTTTVSAINCVENVRSTMKAKGYSYLEPGQTHIMGGSHHSSTLSCPYTVHVATDAPSPAAVAVCILLCTLEAASVVQGAADFKKNVGNARDAWHSGADAATFKDDLRAGIDSLKNKPPADVFQSKAAKAASQIQSAGQTAAESLVKQPKQSKHRCFTGAVGGETPTYLLSESWPEVAAVCAEFAYDNERAMVLEELKDELPE